MRGGGRKDGEEREEAYVYMLLSCPSVPEERDRDEAREEDTSRQPHLGLEDTTIRLRHSHNRRIGYLGHKSKTEEEADAETDVGESTHVGLPAVGLLEDLCHGCEEKIHHPVADCHVDGEEEDDRGEEEHF